MNKIFLKPVLLSFAIALGLHSPIAYAVELNTSQNVSQGYKFHLQDADIKAFIEQIASITHKNFVLDPKIKGNVTVFSDEPLSSDKVYDLFLSVMKVNGIKVVERGNITELLSDTTVCR